MQQQNLRLNRVDHALPIFSPRTTYDIIRQNDENMLSDLTLNFDPFTINVLKNEFYMRNWDMNIVEFIQVVKEHLLSWQINISNREQKLIRCLIMLFHEIDLNGNGVLEWDEFTNFIIEKATVLNSIKTKKDEIKNYTMNNLKINFQKINNQKAMQQNSGQNGQQQKFQNPIAKTIYISSIDRVAFFEESSNEIFLLNAMTGEIEAKSLKIIPKQIMEDQNLKKNQDEKKERKNDKISMNQQKKERKTMILDIYYIKDKKYNALLTSTSDGFVKGWRYTVNGFVLATQPDSDDEYLEHYFKNNIYCMEFDNESELLYCGQKDGNIHIWNLKTDTKSFLEKDGHQSVIMSMIAMPKLQFLASAALDKYWILWDTIDNKKKRIYHEHTRGILSLAFNESLILLFSAGFNHEFYVWNPYIDKYIYKIVGHSSPLVGVIVIENTTQLVSLDSDGYVKVWDIKKFNCVQTFSVEYSDDKHKFNPQHLGYIPHPLKMIISGRTIQMYDYDKGYNPNFVDDYLANCCKFVPDNLVFLTPHGFRVKVWNALTGDILKIYQDLTEAEISFFGIDELKKRMLIGDSMGNAYIYNVINGAFLKKLPKHHGEIFHMFDIREKEIIVSAGMDLTIRISEDIELNESPILRVIQVQDTMFSSMDYDRFNKLILLGTNNGSIIGFEIDNGKINDSFSKQEEEEITSVISIDESPYMWSSNSKGDVSLVALPPLLIKYHQVFNFINYDLEKTKRVGVVCMQYDQIRRKLYLGDDRSFIKCYDVSQVMDALKVQRNAQYATRDQKVKQNSMKPCFNDIEVVLEWSTKTHQEQLKSIELVCSENIFITTAYDKKVKIWNMNSGEYIDSFQQNYDKLDPDPISFKRINTDQYYSTDFNNRVDMKYTDNQRQKMNNFNDKDKQFKYFKNSTNQVNYNSDDKKKKKKKDKDDKEKEQNNNENGQNEQKSIMNYVKCPQEEFNPIHDYSKLDLQRIVELNNGNKRAANSNSWNLQINYMKYHDEFENEYNTILDKVQKMESEIRKQNELKRQEKEKEEQQQEQKGSKDRKSQNNQSKQVQQQGDKQYAQQLISNIKKNAETKYDQQTGGKGESGVMSEEQKTFNQKAQQQTQMDINQNMQSSVNKSKQMLNIEMFKKRKTMVHDTQLHKKQLKSNMVDRHQKQIHLSKEEKQAAYKLAAALSNFDNEDLRVLKFFDIQEKEQKHIYRIRKDTNYVKQNIKKIDEMMKEITNYQNKQFKKALSQEEQ